MKLSELIFFLNIFKRYDIKALFNNLELQKFKKIIHFFKRAFKFKIFTLFLGEYDSDCFPW